VIPLGISIVAGLAIHFAIVRPVLRRSGLLDL
jgi:hypothetical protein